MLLRKAKIVVLPYIAASQSGVIGLAYSHSRPVIVTNVGGLGEIVQEGKTGYLVNPDSVEIANSIIKYYTNSDKINFKVSLPINKISLTNNQSRYLSKNIINLKELNIQSHYIYFLKLLIIQYIQIIVRMNDLSYFCKIIPNSNVD